MIKKFSIYNRPISPHLVIYSPQPSSLFSIWHRITGIILLTLLFTPLLFFKLFSIYNFIYSSPISEFFYLFEQLFWLINVIYTIILLIFLYHSLNGIRHIIWDLGLFLDLKYLFISSLLSIIIIFFILILNTLNF